MPAELLKLTQSRTFLKESGGDKVCNKKGQTLLQYFDQHSGIFNSDPTKKPRNFAAMDQILKIAPELLDYVTETSAKDLKEETAPPTVNP